MESQSRCTGSLPPRAVGPAPGPPPSRLGGRPMSTHLNGGRGRRCSPDFSRTLPGRAPQCLLRRRQPSFRQLDLFDGAACLPLQGGRLRWTRGLGNLHLRLTPHGGVGELGLLLLLWLEQLGGGGGILSRVPLRQRSRGPVLQDLNLQKFRVALQPNGCAQKNREKIVESTRKAKTTWNIQEDLRHWSADSGSGVWDSPCPGSTPP